MLSKSILAAILAVASVSNAYSSTPPSTSCTTIGTGNKHTRSYTRQPTCTNTLPKMRTVSTTVTTQPVSTSTVETTETDTASTSTSTATETNTETDTTSVTSTETAVSTSSVTTTKTITSYYGSTLPSPSASASAPAGKRDVQFAERGAATPTTTRPAPPPGVVCVVNRCVRTRATTTITSTSVLSESTATVTDTQTTTVTPNASTTTTVSTTVTSTSSFTTTTTSTSTYTSTITTTYTATPTFYIMSSEATGIADGTNLTNVPDRIQGEGRAQFVGGGTLFALDPQSGGLYDLNRQQYANVASTGDNSIVYFDTPALIVDAGYPECACDITTSLDLTCTCGGNSVFQVNGNFLFIASSSGQSGLSNEQPVVEIVGQH